MQRLQNLWTKRFSLGDHPAPVICRNLPHGTDSMLPSEDLCEWSFFESDSEEEILRITRRCRRDGNTTFEVRLMG
jgi:hypothetical protein